MDLRGMCFENEVTKKVLTSDEVHVRWHVLITLKNINI